MRSVAADKASSVFLSNERLLNKKLASIWVSETDSAKYLHDKIRDGEIRSLTSAKTKAAKVYKSNSNLDNTSRVTHMPSMLHYNYIVWFYLCQKNVA